MAACCAKLSKRTAGRLAILRKSVVDWKLNMGGLLSQAFQTKHGPPGHLGGSVLDISFSRRAMIIELGKPAAELVLL